MVDIERSLILGGGIAGLSVATALTSSAALSTAPPRPSARNTRTPFAGRLIPAPIAGHAVLRSMSSG